MKAVLDTNIIVSGVMGHGGIPRLLLDHAIAGSFTSIASDAMMRELDRVLGYPRIARLLGDDAPRVLESYRAMLAIVEPADTTIDIRDPDDAVIVQTAIAGEAQYIVTGDADLLALGEYEEIEIVTPAQFLARLAELPER